MDQSNPTTAPAVPLSPSPIVDLTPEQNASATNTAPTVTVTGVTDGASYDKGSVPTAMCHVVDAEDAPAADFAATLSAITGTYASDGIVSRTASCAYTDGGEDANPVSPPGHSLRRLLDFIDIEQPFGNGEQFAAAHKSHRPQLGHFQQGLFARLRDKFLG